MYTKECAKRKLIVWSREMIEKFIQLFREHECLYNTKNKSYYNRRFKDDTFKLIKHEMRKFRPTIQIADIRKKLKVLRTQYAHEIRMLALARSQGREYEPKLWCFYKLEFLEFHTKCQKSSNDTSNKELPTAPANPLNFSDDENFKCDQNEEEISQPMAIYKEEIVDEDDLQYDTDTGETSENLFDDSENTAKPIVETLQQKYEWVGEMVVSQIQDINSEERAEFIWDMQCLIRKYILKSKHATRECKVPI